MRFRRICDYKFAVYGFFAEHNGSISEIPVYIVLFSKSWGTSRCRNAYELGGGGHARSVPQIAVRNEAIPAFADVCGGGDPDASARNWRDRGKRRAMVERAKKAGEDIYRTDCRLEKLQFLKRGLVPGRRK